jgi:hypothetical protein
VAPLRALTALALGVACVLPAVVAPAPALGQLVEVGRFEKPVYATAAPGDRERLYVVERGGRIVVHRLDGGAQTTFLDQRDLVTTNGERGLLSLAFPPDFGASRRLYIFHTGRDGDVHIEELTAPTADAADPASRRTLAVVEHSGIAIHNGGQLQMRDGVLYASLGDAKNPARAQDPASWLGRIVAIDPATGAASTYAKGLRNPWRFSFDRATGAMVVTDVGERKREEANWIPAGHPGGLNFGWPCFEGTLVFPPGCALADHTPPTFERSIGRGVCAIIGGYVIRDVGSPDAGRYVYGDYCEGTLRTVILGPDGAADDRPTTMSVPSLASFGEDACGRVYAVSLAGPVSRLARSGCPP